MNFDVFLPFGNVLIWGRVFCVWDQVCVGFLIGGWRSCFVFLCLNLLYRYSHVCIFFVQFFCM